MLTKKKDCAKIQNVNWKALWKNSLKRAPKAFQMANQNKNWRSTQVVEGAPLLRE